MLAKTEAQLRELYKAEYTKGQAERRTFARELLTQAHNANSDPATRFVFYREARNVAAAIGVVTADGSPMPYSNWGGGEPSNSNGTEHYARLERNGKWNDIDVGPYKTVGFVCEWE